jgi:hypothetical protein
VCVVQASNPGGVSTARSATTPPIAADTAPPIASITALNCRLQACTLSLSANDPNAVAIAVTSSVTYRVPTRCPVRKRKGKGKGKGGQPVCHKTRTVGLPLSLVSAGAFSAAASRLPYGQRLSFAVSVVNAAGLRPASAVVGTTVLRKPKPKKKKKKKPKKKSGH